MGIPPLGERGQNAVLIRELTINELRGNLVSGDPVRIEDGLHALLNSRVNFELTVPESITALKTIAPRIASWVREDASGVTTVNKDSVWGGVIVPLSTYRDYVYQQADPKVRANFEDLSAEIVAGFIEGDPSLLEEVKPIYADEDGEGGHELRLSIYNRVKDGFFGDSGTILTKTLEKLSDHYWAGTGLHERPDEEACEVFAAATNRLIEVGDSKVLERVRQSIPLELLLSQHDVLKSFPEVDKFVRETELNMK